MSRKTSRDLNGALLRGLFLGAHTRCTTPSVDVQSVPRFTLIDYHGRQAYQKKTHQRLLLWEVSVVQQRRSGLREVIMDDVQQLKNSSLTLHPLDTCNAQIAIVDMVAQ